MTARRGPARRKARTVLVDGCPCEVVARYDGRRDIVVAPDGTLFVACRIVPSKPGAFVSWVELPQHDEVEAHLRRLARSLPARSRK